MLLLVAGGCDWQLPTLPPTSDVPDVGLLVDLGDEPARHVDVPPPDSDVIAITCSSGQTPCGAACVELATDPAHCGTCATTCAGATNGRPSCVGGVCGITCVEGFRDCDRNAATGCEASTLTSTQHCGDCDRACVVRSHGTPACVAGTCAPRCEAGYMYQAGDCVLIRAPRPIAPLSNDMLSTQSPTLRWELAPGTSGAWVEVCRDRACAQTEHAASVTGTSLRVPSALPPGAHFWRLTGVADDLRGTEVSPTWEVRVGVRSMPRGSNYGAFADYNGDGFTDLAVPSSEVGTETDRIYVYFGANANLHARPDQTLVTPAATTMSFGWAYTGGDLHAGDLNGDGYADLAARLVRTDSPPQVVVYYGGAAGLSAMSPRSLSHVTMPGTNNAYAISAAGDLNGDGYGDLLVGDTGVPEQYDDNAGFVHVYYGSASGVRATPDTTLSNGVRERLLGWSLAGGDLNADGLSEALVTAPERSLGTGTLRFFPGSRAGISIGAMITIPNPFSGGKMGNGISFAGDLNGDGFGDVVASLGSYGSTGPRRLVFLGGAMTPTMPAQVLTLPTTEGTLNTPASGGGDLNGDGLADLVVSVTPATFPNSLRVYVYHGGSSGYETPAATALSVRALSAMTVSRLCLRNDFNNDGYADLYAHMSIFNGRPNGLSSMASVTLAGP
jgi:hypothetical protein